MRYMFHFYGTLKTYMYVHIHFKNGKFIVTIYFSISDTGITQAPLVPVQKTYTFILKYKATVDCYNVEIRNQIAANILVTIRAHLRELVKRFSKLCILQEIRNCFASIEVLIKECHRIALRKRATGPSAIDVELNIPDLGYVK